jgi:hypothetical protein
MIAVWGGERVGEVQLVQGRRQSMHEPPPTATSLFTPHQIVAVCKGHEQPDSVPLNGSRNKRGKSERG